MKSTSGSTGRVRITGRRAGRLFKLLKILSEGGSTKRTALLKKLRVGTRTFYRDIDMLRECGVALETESDGYSLKGSLDSALENLPFPDPELTFADVLSLVKGGKSKAHRDLKQKFDEITA